MMKNKTRRRVNKDQNYSELSEDEQINLNLAQGRKTNNKRIRENIFNTSESEEDNSTESRKDTREIT